MIDRRYFIGMSAAAALSPRSVLSAEEGAAGGSVGALKVRFLGTGGWTSKKVVPNADGEIRRFSSILVDGRTLVDYTERNVETLPDGCRPEAVFYTHSHPDHFNANAAIALGVKRVWCHESWVKAAREMFASAANGRALPEVNGIAFGQKVEEGGVSFTSLPANHTARMEERCSIYLLEKGATRLLYATDTGGIPGEAIRLAGLQGNVERPLTALIMEATAGPGYEDRADIFFTHSSAALVGRTVKALLASKRYCPPEGRPAWITHFIRHTYPKQSEIKARLPEGLEAAYDGLEIMV